VSYLLGAGCAVNATDHAGLTPLLCAAAALETDAHVDVILRLLQEGADPDAKRLDDDLCALELVELASPLTLLQHRTPSGEAGGGGVGGEAGGSESGGGAGGEAGGGGEGGGGAGGGGAGGGGAGGGAGGKEQGGEAGGGVGGGGGQAIATTSGDAASEAAREAASEAASRRVRAAASTRRQQRAARVALALVAARSARADLGEGLCNSIARAPVAALGHCLLS